MRNKSVSRCEMDKPNLWIKMTKFILEMTKFIFTVLLVFNSPSKTQDKKFFIKKKFYPKINLGNNQSIKNFIYEWLVERIFYFIYEYFYFIQYFGQKIWSFIKVANLVFFYGLIFSHVNKQRKFAKWRLQYLPKIAQYDNIIKLHQYIYDI